MVVLLHDFQQEDREYFVHSWSKIKKKHGMKSIIFKSFVNGFSWAHLFPKVMDGVDFENEEKKCREAGRMRKNVERR